MTLPVNIGKMGMLVNLDVVSTAEKQRNGCRACRLKKAGCSKVVIFTGLAGRRDLQVLVFSRHNFCFQFAFRQVIYKQIMKVDIANSVLELLDGDITEMDTDAIVNAANAQLVLGGGVAGAIRQKGGPAIQRQCDKIGGTFVGGAVITTGGNLKAKYVIHAVGPRIGDGSTSLTTGGDEDEKLKNATLNSLKLADKHNLKSIAFPAISAGIFGFPIDRCADIMLRTTIDYLKAKTGLKKVVFCLFGRESYAVFERQLGREIAQ